MEGLPMAQWNQTVLKPLHTLIISKLERMDEKIRKWRRAINHSLIRCDFMNMNLM